MKGIHTAPIWTPEMWEQKLHFNDLPRDDTRRISELDLAFETRTLTRISCLESEVEMCDNTLIMNL